MFYFFFSSRRRHTRYWRDWSSDVCSSDLCSAVASAVAQVDFAVTPTTTVAFGNVDIGTSATQTFTVQNTRGGTVTGTASVGAPFGIVSGSPFTLVGSGTTATVTVRFTPTSTAAASTN